MSDFTGGDIVLASIGLDVEPFLKALAKMNVDLVDFKNGVSRRMQPSIGVDVTGAQHSIDELQTSIKEMEKMLADLRGYSIKDIGLKDMINNINKINTGNLNELVDSMNALFSTQSKYGNSWRNFFEIMRDAGQTIEWASSTNSHGATMFRTVADDADEASGKIAGIPKVVKEASSDLKTFLDRGFETRTFHDLMETLDGISGRMNRLFDLNGESKEISRLQKLVDVLGRIEGLLDKISNSDGLKGMASGGDAVEKVAGAVQKAAKQREHVAQTIAAVSAETRTEATETEALVQQEQNAAQAIEIRARAEEQAAAAEKVSAEQAIETRQKIIAGVKEQIDIIDRLIAEQNNQYGDAGTIDYLRNQKDELNRILLAYNDEVDFVRMQSTAIITSTGNAIAMVDRSISTVDKDLKGMGGSLIDYADRLKYIKKIIDHIDNKTGERTGYTKYGYYQDGSAFVEQWKAMRDDAGNITGYMLSTTDATQAAISAVHEYYTEWQKLQELIRKYGDDSQQAATQNTIVLMLKSYVDAIDPAIKATQDFQDAVRYAERKAGAKEMRGNAAQTQQQYNDLLKENLDLIQQIEKKERQKNKMNVAGAAQADREIVRLKTKQLAVEAQINAMQKAGVHNRQLEEEIAEKITRARSSTSQADVNAQQAHYDELLKQQYDYQQRLVKLQDEMTNHKVKSNEATDEQNRIMAKLAPIQSEIAAMEKAGYDNQKLKNQLMEKMNRLVADQGMQMKSVTGIGDKLLSQLTSMLRMYVGIHALRRLWSEAKKYATEYYDAINEIRMVTGMTEAEADGLIEKYQDLAVEMKASSTEIAKAAVTYYRQGLSTDDVNERLIATTKYAKIAGIEFNTAADIMTAAMNTLGKASGMSAEEITDVFILLGNAAGSSAQEIGTAMQKASASAEAAGVSFEWLGSYIATISEATRQNAESIGTAMTTLMSRLHAIRSSGYNSEDDFGVNDVAKALAKIDVSLFDKLTGEWRDVPDIFNDIAKQWDTLDDRTKSYIATVMAGTRQQNYFLALMQDMAKGAEGGSRAFELYEEAMNAAGTTAESYAVYTESVKSAQDEMTANLERMYSTIVNDDVLKMLYHSLSTVAKGFTDATKASNSLNILLPVAAAGILMVVSAVKKLMALNPVTAVVGLVGAFAEVLITVDALDKQAKKDSLSETISRYQEFTGVLKQETTDVKSLVEQYNRLRSQYEKLSPNQAEVKSLQKEMDQILDELIRKYPRYSDAIQKADNGNTDYAGSIGRVNDKLNEQLALLEQVEKKTVYLSMLNGGNDSSSAVTLFNRAFEDWNGVQNRSNPYLALADSGIFNDSLFGSAYAGNLYNDFINGVQAAQKEFMNRVKASVQVDSLTGGDRNYAKAIQSALTDIGFEKNILGYFTINDNDLDLLSAQIKQYQGAGFDYMQAAEQEVKRQADQLAMSVYGYIDESIRSGYTAAESTAVTEAISDYIISGFGASGGKDVGVWIANWISSNLFDQVVSGASAMADKNAMSELFKSIFMEDTVDDGVDYGGMFVQAMIDRGLNSDGFKRAVENAKKLGVQFDITEFFIKDLDSGENIISQEDFADMIARFADFGSAVKEAFAASFNDVNAGDFVESLYNGLAESGYNADQIAQIFKRLNLKGLTLVDLIDLSYSDDVSKSVEAYLGDLLADVSRTWSDLLDGYVNNSSISTNDKLGFANKLLGEISSTGGIGSFLDAYGTIDSKTKKNTIQGMLGIDDDTWSDIVSGTATIEQMTEAIMKARAEIMLGSNPDGYMNGLAEAFKNAAVGGRDFVSSAQSVAEDIVSYQKMSNALNYLLDGGTDKSYADTVREYFGLGDTFADWASLLGSVNNEAGRMNGSFAWVETQLNEFARLNGITIDWAHQTEDLGDDLEQLALSGNGMISYLAQMYLWMNDARNATDQNRESLLDYFTAMKDNMADTTMGTMNAVTTVMNKMRGNWDEFSRGWSSISDLLKDVVGDDFYTAMTDGEIESYDQAMGYMEKRFASLTIQREQEIGRVIDGSADDFAKALSGEWINGSNAQQAAEDYVKQFYSYLAVKSGEYSQDDLSNLGMEGLTGSAFDAKLNQWSATIGNNISLFENTVEQMWGVVLDLTGIEAQNETLLAEYAANAENEYASLANYLLMIIDLYEQMNEINPFVQLFNTIGSDGDVTVQDQVGYLTQLISLLSDGGESSYASLQQALDLFASGDKLKNLAEALGMTEDELKQIVVTAYSTEKATRAFDAALTNASKKKNGFANIYNNIEQIRKASDKAAKSAAMLSSAQQVESAVKSWESAVDEYYNAVDAISKGGSLSEQSLSSLANALGTTEQALRNSWSQVPQWMQEYVSEANAAISDLQGEHFLQITGIGSFDFSSLINGCLYVEASAGEAANELAKLGDFELKTEQVDSVVDVLQKTEDGYKVVKKKLTGSYQLLKPTKSNPLSTGRRTPASSGGGGGGGGGGSSNENSGKTQEQIFVERVEEALKRVGDKMTQLNTQISSFDSQGFFTAEINAIDQVNELLNEQDDILRNKIAEAQGMLPGLYRELNGLSFGTAEYDVVLGRIEDIQGAVVEWSQKLTENEAQIISNRKRIDELKKSIRQLEIDLENEVLQAIENREEKQEAMLQARIDMENTILDILKEQAEDAEQAILDSIEKQIDALNREKDAISELLDKRKEESEQEDKLVELRKLESKYAMISVDPTRARESRDLLEQINDLRNEIAWDNAENEAEQQQKSIDQQISSLEDYKEYIQKYYEDLLNNPKNFIDQVNAILEMSQEDILAWLSQNSSEYEMSTESTQASMINSWTDTLNEMHGVVETHWQEVYDIIAQGEEYVLNFLRQNSSDFASASRLQQEAYLEGWMEMFDKLKRAYQDMQTTVTDTSGYVSTVTSGVSSSGGSGSGAEAGSDPGGSGVINGYKVTVKGKGQTNEFKFGKDELDLANEYVTQLKAQHPEYTITGPKKYKRGGYIDYTGLAQVDGSMTQPEYMLNASQTRMMEKLVSTLEMATVKAPSIPAFDSSLFKASTATSNVFNGGINISVESLEDDADFDALAERVKESIVNAMTYGKSIGF